LKLELISLENERGKAFEEAGQLAHTLYKNGNELPEEMKEIFMTIDEVEKRIDTKRKELERIRAEDVSQCVDELEQEVDDVTVLVCRQCENEVTQEDIFCSRCGSHLK
jgi:seryl-tRNA synthetase